MVIELTEAEREEVEYALLKLIEQIERLLDDLLDADLISSIRQSKIEYQSGRLEILRSAAKKVQAVL